MHALLATLEPVLVPCGLQLVEASLQGLPEEHDLVGLDALSSAQGDGALEHLVVEGEVTRPRAGGGVEDLIHPVAFLGQPQNRGIGSVVDEVGVLHGVSGVGKGEPHSIRRVLLDGFPEGLKVSGRLGHLLVVQQEVAIAPHPPGPLLLGPNRRVVIQRECEVVLDQVLPADPQVKGVPVVELRLHGVQGLRRDARVRRQVPEPEHVVPHRVGQAFRLDFRLVLAVHLPALQDMRNGVVRHVYRRVRERLDEKFLVPGHQRPEAEGPGAGPLPHPAQGVLEGVPDLVHLKDRHVREAIPRLLQPALLAVLQVPLVRQRHNALVPTSAHHLLLGLKVNDGITRTQEVLLDQRLGVLDLLAGVLAHRHHTLGETLEVGHLLGLLELSLVVLALDLEHCADLLGGSVPKLWDGQHGNHLKGQDVLVLDSELLAELGLLLQVAQAHVVIGGVARDAGHNPSPLGERDREQWQHVDCVVLLSQRGLEGHPHQVVAGEVQNLGGLAELWALVLVCQVPRRVLADHVDLAVEALVRAVRAIRQDPGVGLAVHGLRPEGSGEHEDLTLVLGELAELSGKLQDPHLDESVLLGPHPLSRGPIVVRAGLAVKRGVHRVPLVLDDLAELLELPKLPPDKGVVVRVDVGGDEAPPPVHAATHGLDVPLCQRGKVLEPVKRFLERRDLVFWDTALLQYLVLGGSPSLFRLRLTFLPLGLVFRLKGDLLRFGLLLLLHAKVLGVNRGAPVQRYFPLQFVRTRLNRHTRAVKALWKKNVLALQSVVRSRELQLRQ
mmetsp:Transcript_10726/g.38087  ORF Transcript_10726/g.38087 Transcript_10726/m.38087 type:complete len:780 (-) Transcript_10726:298-2637(-)